MPGKQLSFWCVDWRYRPSMYMPNPTNSVLCPSYETARDFLDLVDSDALSWRSVSPVRSR